MIYSCGDGSTLLVSNHNIVADSFTVDSVQLFIQAGSTLSFSCSGDVDVTPWGNIAVQMVSAPLVDWGQALSFLAGLLVALAFASASLKKW